MASRAHCTHKKVAAKGFTLLEVLLVVGIIALLGGSVAALDIRTYFGAAFVSEQQRIVTLLHRARADAQSNMGEVPHGLSLYPPDNSRAYVLFSGASSTTDPASHAVFEAGYSVSIEGAPVEIIFEPLTGRSNYAGTLMVRDYQRGVSAPITINHEGAISW